MNPPASSLDSLKRYLARPATRNTIQKIGFGGLALLAGLTVLPIILLVLYIFYQGGRALSPEFLFGFPSQGMKAGGIWPAIVGTLYLTFGTALFSVPLGIGPAIYLSEYPSDNQVTRLLRLAIMTLPVIISTTEESLRAVPQSFRVVSISMGATRWQTIRRIVLPEALPGILTGVILGLERAAGETAPILFTAAAFFLPQLPHSPLDQTMALPYHLFVISTQVPGMPVAIQYGTALVLLIFVLGMNILATVIRSRARARRQW